jgi:hypothetical protein
VKRPRPGQIRRSSLPLFAAQALALALLIGHWPTPKQHYPALLHAHAAPILSWATGHPVGLRGPQSGDPADLDTVMKGYAQGSVHPLWVSRFSVTRVGYWPSAVLAALILATPLAPLRRVAALLAGLLLLNLVTLGRLGVEIAYAYYEVENGPGQAAQGAAHFLLRVGSESLTATIPSAAAVLLIWVLVANPRRALDLDSFRALLGLGAAAAASPGEEAEPAPPGEPPDAGQSGRGPA